MNYWLDLFTGATWEEFQKAGASVSGFRPRMRNLAKTVQTGDILLCYLTGVMRWVGALEVIGPSKDDRPIWKDVDFPVRFDVKPLVVLQPENGIPMSELEGRVDFFRSTKDRGKFRGFVRMSPNRFTVEKDGALVLELLRHAQSSPIERPVDPKKLAYRPKLFKAEQRKGKRTVSVAVTVPEPEEIQLEIPDEQATEAQELSAATKHTEIQYNLLSLGADMGNDVWVARNDRSKQWQGKVLGEMPRMVTELPSELSVEGR